MSKKSKKSKNKKEKALVQDEVKTLDFEGVEFSAEDDPLQVLTQGEEVSLVEEGASSTDQASVVEGVSSLQEELSLEGAPFIEEGSSEEDPEAAFIEESESLFVEGAEDEAPFEDVTPDDSSDMALEAQDENEDEPVAEINENGEVLEIQQITDDEAVSVIESLLFISDRPVGMTTFKNAFVGTNVTTKKIKALIAELQGDLAQTRRGVSLEEVDGAFQLRTKVDNQSFIKKIMKARVFKLTGPSLETLSVIAYKQPCIKADVDEVRGVESGHLIRALMDKGLVAFAGKSDLPGKPMFYKTTRKFLEIFGLRNINELPTLKEMEELLPEGIGEEEEKETLSDLTGKLSENYDGNYSVAEDELGKITEQLAGITTNTEFFEEEKRKQKEKQERERAEALQEALALGEEVDPKDAKWLERYEAKLAAELEQAEAQASVAESQSDEAESPLEALVLEDNLNDEIHEETEEQGDDKQPLLADSETESSEDPLDLL